MASFIMPCPKCQYDAKLVVGGDANYGLAKLPKSEIANPKSLAA